MAVQVLKNNMTSGVLSPKLHFRSDLEQYSDGLATCHNAIVSPYGGVQRRFGSRYVAAAKHADKLCIVRTFEFAEDQSYTLEIGDQYIRFYIDGGQIIDGTPVEVATTYLESELRELRFEYDADVLYICHFAHAPAKLIRSSHISWSLADCDFVGGPFYDENTSADTLASNGVTGSVTITASADTFESGHVGSLWKLTSGKMVDEVTGSFASTAQSASVKTASETVELEVSGTWVAIIIIEHSFDKGTNWYPYRTVTENVITQLTDTRDVEYRLNCTHTSGTANYRLSVMDTGAGGYGSFKITAFTSATQCTATVVNELRSTDATTIWAEAEWSGVRGYPRCCKIYEGRLWFASTDENPLGLWGTAADLSYRDMTLGSNDADAVAFSLNSVGGLNIIKWMSAWQQLSVGSTGGEIRVQSPDGGITPTSPPQKRQDTYYGSAEIQAFIASRSVIFVDRTGRILREYVYDDGSKTYDSPDLSLLAEHLLVDGGGIIDAAYQQKPHQLIWCVLNDGTLAAITYKPAQQVFGWHSHSTANTIWGTGSVLSVSVRATGVGHDELWMVIKRKISDSYVRYIEYMNEDEQDYRGICPTPVFTITSINGGDQLLEITAITGSTVYYTTDGTIPDEFNTLYTGEFTPSSGTMITAYAVRPEYIDSGLVNHIFNDIVYIKKPDYVKINGYYLKG